MPKITFIIASVETRVDELNGLVDSIIADHRLDNVDINLFLQDKVGGAYEKIKNKDRYAHIFCCNEWIGVHNARIRLLRQVYDEYDVFINMDDDMLVGAKTDYSRAIELCQREDVGFVITAWARYEKALEKAQPSNKLRKQICCYQGGGMLYSKKIAKLIMDFGEFKTGHDMWSLLAYVKGYDNYYDYSSYTLHKVCHSGGLSVWHGMMDNSDLMLSNYVNLRKPKNPKGNGHDILIPLDSDVNQVARMEHKLNRQKRGWK